MNSILHPPHNDNAPLRAYIKCESHICICTTLYVNTCRNKP
jgi:hypothetical protein